MSMEDTDLSDVELQDLSGRPVILGDRVARHVVLQVLRYYG